MVGHGLEDEKIIAEFNKRKQKKKSKALSVLDKALSAIFACVVVAFFVGSLLLSVNEDKITGDVPTLQVVRSASMSKRLESNEYLFKNNLTNQIDTFDLIVTHELPDEDDLKLYDIVVYEIDNTLLVHRIVQIEDPNKNHPDERWFLLQGDNVERADRFPVRYNQMKAIYRGERVPYVGSFITFIQSPAGYLVVLLVIFTMIVLPVVESKLKKVANERLIALGLIALPVVPEPVKQVEKNTQDVEKKPAVVTKRAYVSKLGNKNRLLVVKTKRG